MDESTAKYRLTLLRDEVALWVLGDILQMCHFGLTLDPENPTQVAEHNVGVAILARLGILAPDTLDQVVMALSGIQSTGKPQDEQLGNDPLGDFR